MSFPASVITAAAQIGVDVSSLGQQEVELLKQILASEIAVVNAGGGGITQLTGDVTAGPGSGSVASTVAMVAGMTVPASITAGTFLYNNAGALAGASGLSINGGALSAVTILGAANATPFTLTGGSITGAATTPFSSVTGTWNTSGSPIASLINITNTASGAAARLQSLQIGGVEQVGFGVDGRIFCVGTASFQGIVKGTNTTDAIAAFLSISGNFYYAGGQLLYSVNNNNLLVGSSGNFMGMVISSTDASKTLTISHNNTNAVLSASSGAISIASGVAFQLGNTATTGLTAGVLAALTNASVTLKDNAGTTYRIPCII